MHTITGHNNKTLRNYQILCDVDYNQILDH